MAEQLHHPQARRSFLALAGAGLLSIALAGCQVVPRRPAPPPPPEPTGPVRPPISPNLPPDETRNRVAVLVPLSGTNAGVGQSIANAANLALLDTGGERIRITVYDTAKGGALAAANEALADGNGLFLGPLLADDARAIATVARSRGVPVIAFSNDSSIAGSGMYLMGFTPTQSITRTVSFAIERGVQRFAALTPQGVYGRRASQAMIDAVERAGGRMVAMQEFGRTPAAMRAAVTTLNGQGAYDAVLIADSGKSAAAVAALVRTGPSGRARILGTELWSTEAGLAALPPLRGAWFASASDTMFNQFKTRYRARYGKTPYRLASLGYDAVLLSVRVAADWRIGWPFPERALLDPGGFAGVDGAFRFRPNGVAERALQVQEIGPAGLTVISPAPRGFSD
ncbi:penicillin-binding protein activator [Sphingomonas sp.]|uniref:penicillin-binding protein activator n=1 Tax=Sphingomonas sp. TaxID=28214 RepID=UPI002FC85B67